MDAGAAISNAEFMFLMFEGNIFSDRSSRGSEKGNNPSYQNLQTIRKRKIERL